MTEQNRTPQKERAKFRYTMTEVKPTSQVPISKQVSDRNSSTSESSDAEDESTVYKKKPVHHRTINQKELIRMKESKFIWKKMRSLENRLSVMLGKMTPTETFMEQLMLKDAEVVQLKSSLETALEEKKVLEDSLSKLQQQNVDLNAALWKLVQEKTQVEQELEDRISELECELERLRSDNNKTTKELLEKIAALDGIKETLKTMIDKKNDLESRLSASQQTVIDISKAVWTLVQEKKDTEQKLGKEIEKRNMELKLERSISELESGVKKRKCDTNKNMKESSENTSHSSNSSHAEYVSMMEKAIESTVGALHELSHDATNRSKMRELKVIPLFIQLLDNQSESIQRVAAGVLSELAGDPEGADMIEAGGAFRRLNELLLARDEHIGAYAASALFKMSEDYRTILSGSVTEMNLLIKYPDFINFSLVDRKNNADMLQGRKTLSGVLQPKDKPNMGSATLHGSRKDKTSERNLKAKAFKSYFETAIHLEKQALSKKKIP